MSRVWRPKGWALPYPLVTDMKHKLLVAAITLASAVSAQASIVMSFGDSTSTTDNDNQAGSFRGVSYKIDVTQSYTGTLSATGGSSGGATNSYTATYGVANPDATATQVTLNSLNWQAGAAISGSAKYLSVFSGLTVNSSGVVTSLGTFIGASTNSILTPAAQSALTWNFSGITLDVGSTYQFVVTSTRTPSLISDVTSINSLEMKTVAAGNLLLAESELIATNTTGYNNRLIWEPVFSLDMTAVPTSVPEPSTYGLMGAGALAAAALVRRRRKRA